MRSEGRIRNLFYAGPVLLLAFALRAYRLGWQSLWYDEGNSAFMTTRSLLEIIAGAAGDIHPPLYYILLSWWSNLVGTGEFSLRFLSLAFGLLLVAVVYKLGQKLFLPQAGLAAAGIAAASPFLVYYSQEARMYMLGTLLCALAGLFFLKALGRDRYWAAYALTAAAALYTQYYALGVIMALNVFFVLGIMWRSGRGLWARWLASNVVVILLYVPWLPSMLNQAAMWPRGGPIAQAAGGIPPEVYQVWLTGPLQLNDFPTVIALGFPALALLALCAIGWPRLSSALRGRPQGVLGRWMGLLLVLTVVLVSWSSLLVPFWRPPFHAKFLIFGLPWFYLWLGLGIVALTCAGRYFFQGLTLPFRRKEREVSSIPWLVPFVLPTSLTLLALVLALSPLQAYYFDPRSARDDYRGLAGYIEVQAQPGDAIILNAPGQTEIFGYYYKGQAPIYPLPRQRPLDEAVTGQDLEAVASDHGRLWVVLWGQWESDPSGFIEQWLERRAYKSADRWFGGVRLALFVVPRPGEEHRVSLDARFGDCARLTAVGFPGVPASVEIPLVRAAAGGIVPLTLHWEAVSPTLQRYKVFVHLLGPSDILWGQHDSEPVGGSRPTTDWQPGEAIADNHGLPVLPGTPPGRYDIEVGLYDMATGKRLPIYNVNGDTIADRMVLIPVEVTKPADFPPRESLAIEHPLEARFNDLSLLGYEFFKLGTEAGRVDFQSGDIAHLALFWRADTSKKLAYYPIHVALLDNSNKALASGKIIAGFDYPTDKWDPGEVVRAQYKIWLDERPGTYKLVVYIGTGGNEPIQPTGPDLKLVDGKLLLTEFQIK